MLDQSDVSTQNLKLRGAKKVIMIEINDNRLETAKQFGVDHTINSLNEDPIDAVRKLTNGKGADKVISANPSTQAQAQQSLWLKERYCCFLRWRC